MNPSHRPDNKLRLRAAIEGCILGTAAGDSVGLPFENLSRGSVAKLARPPLEQSLLWGRGMVSDDTEHTVMTALSLCESAVWQPSTKEAVALDTFGRRMAARLRWWLLALPPGVGSATARAILKLWAGFSEKRSGVFSAGNGPAMRSALLGVVFAENPDRMRNFVRATTRLTHTDPKAFEAALAVAVAAACAATPIPSPNTALPQALTQALTQALPSARKLEQFRSAYAAVCEDSTVMAPALALLERGVKEDWELARFAAEMGCEKGVSGYALHTVPVALYAWFRHSEDFRQAVTATVLCGGDTDSTAAIVGAIVGAGTGAAGIPSSWLDGIVEWPRSVAWMRALSARLACRVHAAQAQPVSITGRWRELVFFPVTLARNRGMLSIVVYVLVRRTVLTAN